MSMSAPAPLTSEGGEKVRLIAASSIGTIVEWYDFFIFATCSVLVFNKTFFPADDPFVGILLSLSSFALGFAARPIGGLIFGILGDRIGRKTTLVISIVMMGLATFAVGLLPTYASVGLLAPALLVLMRIFQGVAVGGEATGALTLVAESMPAKDRGFWVSFAMIGGPAGNVLSALTIILVQRAWGAEAFPLWTWRLPFLASGLLVLFGLWMRMRIDESPVFKELAASGHKESAPLQEAFAHHFKPMGQVFLVKAGENALFYLFTTFFLVFLTQYLSQPSNLGIDALFWASLIEVVVIIIAAALSDRIGRRHVMMVGFVGAIVAAYLMFSADKGIDLSRLFILLVLCLVFHGIIVGSMSPFFAELFPTKVRYTALSVSYQLASVLGGSIAPILGTYLLKATGQPIYVALYAAAIAIPALICAFLARETRGSVLG